MLYNWAYFQEVLPIHLIQLPFDRSSYQIDSDSINTYNK